MVVAKIKGHNCCNTNCVSEIVRDAQMRTRDKFGQLVELFKQTGIGAEVGVQRGYNALNIAKYWSGSILCVDLWPVEKIYQSAVESLTPDKFKLIRMASVEAAAKIDGESLDWVYIDADHHYDEVHADLEAWWPKVRPGGVFAGHDYCILEGGIDGVIVAVNEFAHKHGYRVQLTDQDFYEGNEFPTWWFVK